MALGDAGTTLIVALGHAALAALVATLWQDRWPAWGTIAAARLGIAACHSQAATPGVR